MADALADDRYLSFAEVLARIPFSERQARRLEEDGLFPPRRLIGRRKTAFLESEVLEWMRTRPLIVTRRIS